jgi:predicted Holliday junction resolvase-like endonuclease
MSVYDVVEYLQQKIAEKKKEIVELEEELDRLQMLNEDFIATQQQEDDNDEYIQQEVEAHREAVLDARWERRH